MNTKLLRALIRSRTILHDGFLRVYRYEFDMEKHEGGVQRISWEVMERGNAVAVLGHDPNRDAIVFGNEFRPGALAAGEYAYRDNLVAGAIEEGETALDAAVREMQEETGLVLRDQSSFIRAHTSVQVAHLRRSHSSMAWSTRVTRRVYIAMLQNLRTS